MKFLDAVKFAYMMIKTSGCPAKIVREIRAQFNMSECEIMRVRLAYDDNFGIHNRTSFFAIDIYNRETKKFSRGFVIEVINGKCLSVRYTELFWDGSENSFCDFIFCSDECENTAENIETFSYYENLFDYVKKSDDDQYLITGNFMHKVTDDFEKEHLQECLDNGSIF